jgi:hypothetical protein
MPYAVVRSSAIIASSKHLAAVAGSFRYASEAAVRGDYRDALGWLQVLEAVGEELPSRYLAKRQEWLCLCADGPAAPGGS